MLLTYSNSQATKKNLINKQFNSKPIWSYLQSIESFMIQKSVIIT